MTTLLTVLLLTCWTGQGCAEGNGAHDGPHDPLAGMEMVWIPPGSFVMGSTPEEEGRQANDGDEGPPRPVTISRGFWLGRFEVTQDQWEAVTGRPAPSHFSGGSRPVERVSWDEVQTFLLRLNQLSGVTTYRLPTEAEWEYACRAGSSEPFSFGRDRDLLGRYAWYDGNSGGETHPVGRLEPNPWGLHDMHGNVWEWCADRYNHSRRRVKRGGAWFYPWFRCRSADRARGEPDARSSAVGFRLVRDAD